MNPIQEAYVMGYECWWSIVLNRIRIASTGFQSVLKVLKNFSTMDPVHEHDWHTMQIYQGRAHRKLGITPAGNARHASLHSSFRPQLIYQVCHAIFAANVKPQNSASKCSKTFQWRITCDLMKQLSVGRSFIWSYQRADSNEWRTHTRARDDRTSAPTMAVIKACLCRS